jgi:hypothetical protein
MEQRPSELTNEDCHRCLAYEGPQHRVGRYGLGLIGANGLIVTDNRYQILIPDDSD